MLKNIIIILYNNNMPQMYFMSWNNQQAQPQAQAQAQRAQPRINNNILRNRLNNQGNIYDMLEVIRQGSGSCKACGRG